MRICLKYCPISIVTLYLLLRKRKYDEEVAKRKEENRMLEEAFLKEVHGLKPGNEWDRVAKNCGFNNKIVHCKKDRNRMRNVILSMKQTVINGK